ncbi:MAG: MarR family winged helix-turn-helix transcriptional regulator [Pseudomonadota bacterium]
MDIVRCNCLALRKATRKTTQLYDTAPADAGVRSTQYHVLAHLDRQPQGDTIGGIASALVIDRITIGHSLKPLEREGSIETRVGKDRRLRLIALTTCGVAELEATKPLWMRAQRKFETKFGADYAKKLRHDLDHIADDCPSFD